MKYRIPLLIICLITIRMQLSAQNWAPFLVNKQTLYSTPDTTVIPNRRGKSLALVMFDTSVTNGGSTSYFRKDMMGGSVPVFGYHRSYVSLYGMKMEKQGNQYKMYWEMNTPNSPVLLYHPNADVDQVILQSPNWAGFVIDKTLETVNGQLDSVKTLILSETRSFGFPSEYVAKVSKTYGFIQVPDIFSSERDDRPIFSLFGDLEDNLLGINTPLLTPAPFQVGDVLTFRRVNCVFFISQSFCSLDTVKRHFLSVDGDSSLVVDSIKRTTVNPPYMQFISVDTHKILTTFPISEGVSAAPIGRAVSSWSVKSAFLTEDSVLYVGTLPCGWANDAPKIHMVSTRLPLIRYQYNAMFSSFRDEYPIYLRHENRFYGDSIQIIFTNQKNVVQSQEIHLFPNPGSDRLIITGITGKTEVRFFHPDGRLAGTRIVQDSETISTQELPVGIYFLLVKNGQQLLRIRWIKEN